MVNSNWGVLAGASRASQSAAHGDWKKSWEQLSLGLVSFVSSGILDSHYGSILEGCQIRPDKRTIDGRIRSPEPMSRPVTVGHSRAMLLMHIGFRIVAATWSNICPGFAEVPIAQYCMCGLNAARLIGASSAFT